VQCNAEVKVQVRVPTRRKKKSNGPPFQQGGGLRERGGGVLNVESRNAPRRESEKGKGKQPWLKRIGLGLKAASEAGCTNPASRGEVEGGEEKGEGDAIILGRRTDTGKTKR